MYSLGKYAVELLVKKIKNEEDIRKEKVKLDLEIIKRKSTIGKQNIV